jgi:hypothetical protein
MLIRKKWRSVCGDNYRNHRSKTIIKSSSELIEASPELKLHQQTGGGTLRLFAQYTRTPRSKKLVIHELRY